VVFYEKLSFYGLFCRLQICQKCIGGRGSVPDPTVGAQDALPDLLVGWGGGHVPMPHPFGAEGRLDYRDIGASILVPPPVEDWCSSADLELATVLV